MKKILFILASSSSLFCFTQNNIDKAIDDILDSYIESNSGPGISLGIVQNNNLIYHESRGNMNLEYDLAFNDSTIIGLASVTKQFTSACIGVLEKQGKLSIYDDVRNYLPELPFYQDTIRIIHLLNHTSGIRNHNVLLDLKGFDYEHQGYTNKMIEELMFNQKGVNNLPGQKMLYSNTNYVLLALIIERVSGMKLPDFANQELFEVLNMTNSFYQKDLEEVVKNRAYSYYKSENKYKQTKSLTLCIGAGGMASTIVDLAKWSEIFTNPSHDLSYLKDFITKLDTLNNGNTMKHARGMFVSPYENVLTFNHSGRDLGMRSQFLCIPDKKLAIIVYTNADEINAVDLSYQVLDLFLEEHEEEVTTTNPYKHSKKELEKFEGVYQELNSDLRMTVFLEDDTLKALSSFGRGAVPLQSQTINSLGRIDNPSVVYSFPKGEQMEADMLVDFGGAMFYFERIALAKNASKNLEEFAGDYYSNELDVTYELTIVDDQLSLSYPHNYNIILKEGATDTFGANRRTKYSFLRNNTGKVSSFLVASEGTVKGILFEKIK